MNLPELPDSDEVIELRKIVELLNASNEKNFNNNRKLLAQMVEMNETNRVILEQLKEVTIGLTDIHKTNTLTYNKVWWIDQYISLSILAWILFGCFIGTIASN